MSNLFCVDCGVEETNRDYEIEKAVEKLVGLKPYAFLCGKCNEKKHDLIMNKWKKELKE